MSNEDSGIYSRQEISQLSKLIEEENRKGTELVKELSELKKLRKSYNEEVEILQSAAQELFLNIRKDKEDLDLMVKRKRERCEELQQSIIKRRKIIDELEMREKEALSRRIYHEKMEAVDALVNIQNKTIRVHEEVDEHWHSLLEPLNVIKGIILKVKDGDKATTVPVAVLEYLEKEHNEVMHRIKVTSDTTEELKKDIQKLHDILNSLLEI